MGHMPVVAVAGSFPPFVLLREQFGFVPNVFQIQVLLPRLLEAEISLLAALAFGRSALTRAQKEYVLTAVAVARGDRYGLAWHTEMLALLGVDEDAAQAPAEKALTRLCVKLAAFGPSISRTDIELLYDAGFSPEAALDAILLTGLGNFLATLTAGLTPEPDFTAQLPQPLAADELANDADEGEAASGPHFDSPRPDEAGVTIEPRLRPRFGFAPNLYHSLASRPGVVQAEMDLSDRLLFDDTVLPRRSKELLILSVCAANFNTYWVALQGEILRGLGVSLEAVDEAAGQAGPGTLPEADRRLCEFGRSLASAAGGPARAADFETLRQGNFTSEQILEAIVAAALANYRCTLQSGFGAKPDVTPRHILRPPHRAEIVHPNAADPRRTEGGGPPDPDAEFVAAAKSGDANAFAELVNRHGRRVFRTLAGILGDTEEARDAVQDTFLKVYDHLGEFEGRSKFSTWLVSVAVNGGLQRLRERKPMESLDDPGSPELGEEYRPRQIQAWGDNPEQRYAQAERRLIVEREVRRLPAKYRVVVVLRDLEQLSTEEAAQALGLGTPALKARLLRARLMLRESLTPYFSSVARAASEGRTQ